MTGRPCGDDSFINKLEKLFGKRLSALPWGRPRKTEKTIKWSLSLFLKNGHTKYDTKTVSLQDRASYLAMTPHHKRRTYFMFCTNLLEIEPELLSLSFTQLTLVALAALVAESCCK